MVHKKRKGPRNKKKYVFLGAVILLILCTGVGLFVFFSPSSILLRPIPEGFSFNLAPKNNDQKLQQVEEFLEKENILYMDVSIASDSAILITLKDNGQVYLSQENYAEELTSLQVIISRLTMEDKRFRRLDLRYKRPVIVM